MLLCACVKERSSDDTTSMNIMQGLIYVWMDPFRAVWLTFPQQPHEAVSEIKIKYDYHGMSPIHYNMELFY